MKIRQAYERLSAAAGAKIDTRKHGFDDQARPWIVFADGGLVRDGSGMAVLYRTERDAEAGGVAALESAGGPP